MGSWGFKILRPFCPSSKWSTQKFLSKGKNVYSELTYLVLEFYISKYLRTILEVNIPRLNHYEDIFFDNFLLLVFF